MLMSWPRNAWLYSSRTTRWSDAPLPAALSSLYPLPQGYEEGAQPYGGIQPGRYANVDDQRARHHPQQVAGTHDHHVQDDDVLQVRRVGQVHRDVSQAHYTEAGPQQERAGQGQGHQQHRSGPGRRERQLPGGDGPHALAGMGPVPLFVEYVVDDVDGPRQGAEDYRPRQRPQKQLAQLQVVKGPALFYREGQGQEHQDAFAPLDGAHGEDSRPGRHQGGVGKHALALEVVRGHRPVLARHGSYSSRIAVWPGTGVVVSGSREVLRGRYICTAIRATRPITTANHRVQILIMKVAVDA